MVRTWLVKATPLQGRQAFETFRVITDLPGIQRLKQLTDTTPSTEAREYAWLAGTTKELPPGVVAAGWRAMVKGGQTWVLVGLISFAAILIIMLVVLAFRK